MKLILFCLILIFSLECSNNKTIQPLNPHEFTNIFLDSLKVAYPSGKYNIKSDMHIIAINNDDSISIFLNNARNEYESFPDSLKEIIHRYVKASVETIITDNTVDKAKIIPVIKDAGYSQEIEKSLGKKFESLDLAFESYNDKLIILYAQDRESNIDYLTKERIEKASLNKDSLLPLAIKNLHAILPKIERQGDNGLYMMLAGGNYEASLILLPEIWNKQTIPVNGEFVIAIPSRDLLLVTGSNDKEGIRKLKETALESARTSSYHLIPDLFIWNGKKFVTYNKSM